MTAEKEPAKKELASLHCLAVDCGCRYWKRNPQKPMRCRNWNRKGERCDHSVELHSLPAHLVEA